MAKISAKAIVEIIWDGRKNKLSEVEITSHLANAGLSSEQIVEAYQMVEFSLNRAFMETLGGGHTADYDVDPIFRASLKRAREQMPPGAGARKEKTIITAAAGVAILVGLSAIGSVVYMLISLWLASR